MKKLIALLLAVCLICMVSACGAKAPAAETPSSGTEKATETVAEPKQTPTEITWWNYPNSIGEDLSIKLADEFMAKYDWITVNVEQKTADGIAEQISIAANTGALPDVQSGAAQWVLGYATMGLLRPIDACVDKAIWPEAMVQALSVDGSYYIAPYTNNAIGFAVNRDILKACGVNDLVPDSTGTWSFETFTEVLKAVSDPSNGRYGLGYYAADTGGDQVHHCLLWGFGAKSYSDDNKQCVLNSPEAVEGLEYLVNLQDQGLTNPGVAGASCNDVINNMFAGGQVCFVMANSGHMGGIRTAFKEGTYNEFDMDLVPFPTVDGTSSNTASFTDGIWLWDTGDDAREEAANLFMEYLASKDVLTRIGEQEGLGLISPLVDADLSNLSEDAQKAYNLFKYAGNYGIGVPGYAEIRPLLVANLQAAFNHELSAAEALADFENQANEVIKSNLS